MVRPEATTLEPVPVPAESAPAGETPGEQALGYPPPGTASGAQPPAGYPPAGQLPGYRQNGYSAGGYAPATRPPASYPPDGYPPNGYPPDGYPPAGAYGPGGPPPAGYPMPPYPGPPPVAAETDPSCRTHRWGLGAYVAVEAVFLLASVAVGALLGDRSSSSAGALAVALVVPTLLAAGLAVLITMWRGNGPWIDLGLQFAWRDVGVGLAFGLGGLVITIPASLLYVAIAGSDTTSAVGEEFGGIRSGPWLAALVFVIVVFVAPLCEEIVYRGLLWGAVERLGARRWWALAITTVVFALAHFEFTRTPLLLVVAIPIALARLYTGKLVAGWVAHGINNLLPAVSLVLMLLGVLPGT